MKTLKEKKLYETSGKEAVGGGTTTTLDDGTVYSKRKGFRNFTANSLDAYTGIINADKIERLQSVAQRLNGLKLLELNATATGGGVAEMLYSSIPFVESLGIEDEWKILQGNEEYFECTKTMHNLLQGMAGSFTEKMNWTYLTNLEQCASANLIDYTPDVVIAHDPQTLGLTHYLQRPREKWLWRCHIDIEEDTLSANPELLDIMSDWTEHYNGAIFSAAHYIVSRWSIPKFIIPPFIDPFSEKNRELTQPEIDRILVKYSIDSKVPIIAQIGRFDPWKGLDRTIATYRRVRKEQKCQLLIAGGMASDDPEGERILTQLYNQTRKDEDVHILNLPLANRLENYREINALQRAATVIMQPSTKEGFGLVITEALWKGKPVIAGNCGAIPLQIKDGHTGYFYQNPQKTAQLVAYLLNDKTAATSLGEQAKKYVRDHFLMPDRICDYLLAIEMSLNSPSKNHGWGECIVAFHPWAKLDKRTGG